MSKATKFFFALTAVLLVMTVSISYVPMSNLGVQILTTVNGVSTLIALFMSFTMVREDFQK
jgi:Na+/melibiose symporter-like transporter